MAFTGVDDFDGYTTGANLNTLNGGSGWLAAWASATGTMTVETHPGGGGQGGKAVRSNTAAVAQYSRTITAATAGTCGFRMRCSITNPNDFVGAVLQDTGANSMFVRFGQNGNIEIYNSTGDVYETVLASYSADTWYTIEIDFDNPGHANQYRARVNGGSYTAYKTVNLGSYTDIDSILLDDSATNAHTFWVDDIGLAGAVGGGEAPGFQVILTQP